MITAVDSNVLIDILEPDPEYGPHSRRALRACLAEGSVVACDVVWAEVGAQFPTIASAVDAMERIGVAFDAVNREIALRAGEAWASYRRRGGTRERLIADFLIGAHASLAGDRLLTRDRGFYRTSFSELEILDPSVSPGER